MGRRRSRSALYAIWAVLQLASLAYLWATAARRRRGRILPIVVGFLLHGHRRGDRGLAGLLRRGTQCHRRPARAGLRWDVPHLTLRRAPTPVRSLALASAITLIQPLLVSFVMLIPTGAPVVHAAGSIVVACVLVVEPGVVLRIQGRSRTEAAGWLVYRFVIPLAASGVLIAGGVGMLLGWPLAVWAPALFVFATVIVGVQDAWDLFISPDRGSANT